METQGSRRSWRSHRGTWLALLALIAGLIAFGVYEGVSNGSSPATEGGDTIESVEIEPIGDTGFNRVRLAPRAFDRLGIETATVRRAPAGRPARTLIPYSALLYGPNGETWAYVTVAPLTFVRRPVVVEEVDGEAVVVSKGPPVGARVVTVGAAELLGSEIEFEE